MTDNAHVMSKVLVIDGNPDVFAVTKIFCAETNLIGVRAQWDTVMKILRANVDFGAILLAETIEGDPHGGIALAREINEVRPELPIFLRRETREDLDDLDWQTRRMFSAAYTIGSMFRLRKNVEEFIFNRVYPNALVRGIREITEQALLSQFPDAAISCDTPYMVRDRIICGETFSLIPIESHWCRGYMMLQADDADAHGASGVHYTPTAKAMATRLGDNLGEITNLVWGGFKNRYIPEGSKPAASSIQVPIMVKLSRRYISFGSEDPQLCFKYTLKDKAAADAAPIYLYQRFVFNLSWSPEDFVEVATSADELVESGELEMF